MCILGNLVPADLTLYGKLSANVYPFMMFPQRELTKKQIEKLKNQKEKLESLCRTLQAERKQGSSAKVPDVTSNEADLTAPSQGS
jgi:hypothetical protein